MTTKNVDNIPKYKVDLDLDPKSRWTEIINDHAEAFHAVNKIINEEMLETLGGFKKSLADLVLKGTLKSANAIGSVYFSEELKAISKLSNLPLEKVIALQLVYEASTCCTSIVVNHKDGKSPIHIRTMDWAMEFLSPLTIEVEFFRNKKLLFRATTWAGYVGVLTGSKPSQFSASINFRATTKGSFWTNVRESLTGSWPIGFLLRACFEDCSSFDEAKSALSHSCLIAPTYVTLCGVQPGEAALLTRAALTLEQPLDLKQSGGVIVQTNIDHWSSSAYEDIMDSIERRRVAKSLLNGGVPMDGDALWSLMSFSPILNDITIYGTLMRPSDDTYETRLPRQKHGFERDGDTSSDTFNQKATCVDCGKRFIDNLNAAGFCSHAGTWHATFGDCSMLKCAVGLKTSVGKQHWSCCFSTNQTHKVCPKSGVHKAK